MGQLPKRFPEYSIMYKTLTKQIQELELKKKSAKNTADIQKTIEKYETERQKIRNMFPENFFEDEY
jgi:hypothetical protein